VSIPSSSLPDVARVPLNQHTIPVLSIHRRYAVERTDPFNPLHVQTREHAQVD